jgi:hypothetical protein
VSAFVNTCEPNRSQQPPAAAVESCIVHTLILRRSSTHDMKVLRKRRSFVSRPLQA